MPADCRDGHVFEFGKSLKEARQYPVIRYLRVERYFTRPLASLVVRALINTRVTPNQLTVAASAVGVLGGLMYLGGSHPWFIAAGLLVQCSSILDCADGMLARARNASTDYGAYLDPFLDRFVDFFVFSGIALGYYLQSGDSAFLVVSLFGVVLHYLQLSLYYLTRLYQGEHKLGDCAEARGLSIFVILVLSLADQLRWIILLFLAIWLCSLAAKLGRLVRWGWQPKG